MKKHWIRFGIMLILFSTAIDSGAGTITTTAEGINGYEWLTLDLTVNISRDIIETRLLDQNDELYGYRYATETEALALFESYFDMENDGWQVSTAIAATEFLDNFGLISLTHTYPDGHHVTTPEGDIDMTQDGSVQFIYGESIGGITTQAVVGNATNYGIPVAGYFRFDGGGTSDSTGQTYGSSLLVAAPGNQSPVAHSGPDQVVFDEVTLDGSRSDDPDGIVDSYDWVLEYVDDIAHDRTASGVDPTITDLYPGFYNTYLKVTDNEGATNTDTSLVAAAGSCSCAESTMHIQSIVAGTTRGSKGNSKGEVLVTVSDDCGNPVAGANVTGTFDYPFNETRSDVTDINGVAVITTDLEFKKPSYEFCVDSVVKESWDYDYVEACMSN